MEKEQMGKILFMTPVAADAKGAKTHAAEQQAIAVHRAANKAISAYHDVHNEDPSDKQLKEMRIQTAHDLGAEDVAILLEHDPDRYQSFIERFFTEVYREFKEEQPSKGEADG
jgi:hypothetical protein